ncbi:hypothetical protein [Thalassotalea fusca]
MSYKNLLLVGLSLVLVACSSVPTVHVFPHYLTAHEKQKVVASLEAAEFEVQISEQVPPDGITQNSIVFSPALNAQDMLADLMTTLGNAGYEISSTNLIFSGNHSFSQNNVGVYLIPDGFVPPVTNYSIPFESEYLGDNCPNSNTLTIQEDKTFTLLVERWNADTEQYDESSYQGFWSREDVDSVQLRFENRERLNFRRTVNVERDNNGARKRVRLLPTAESGNFSLKNVICSYSIALVL